LVQAEYISPHVADSPARQVDHVRLEPGWEGPEGNASPPEWFGLRREPVQHFFRVRERYDQDTPSKLRVLLLDVHEGGRGTLSQDNLDESSRNHPHVASWAARSTGDGTVNRCGDPCLQPLCHVGVVTDCIHPAMAARWGIVQLCQG